MNIKNIWNHQPGFPERKNLSQKWNSPSDLGEVSFREGIVGRSVNKDSPPLIWFRDGIWMAVGRLTSVKTVPWIEAILSCSWRTPHRPYTVNWMWETHVLNTFFCVLSTWSPSANIDQLTIMQRGCIWDKLSKDDAAAWQNDRMSWWLRRDYCCWWWGEWGCGCASNTCLSTCYISGYDIWWYSMYQ